MDLSEVRREYIRDHLERENLANDPIDQFDAWFEQARAAGLKAVTVTAGYINAGPLRILSRVIDASNLDIKTMNPAAFQRNSGGVLKHVLRGAVIAREEGVWLEITNLVIPTFAVERAQELVYHFGRLVHDDRIPDIRIYLDSPMAIKASKVYWDYPHLYDEEATRLRRDVDEMPLLKTLHLTTSVQDSMAINNIKSGAIIIAGSGMCNGGRIVHHLKRNIAREGTHIMIVGYQAYGTLGRKLVDGDQQVKIHGDYFPVRAQIHTVGGLSAHADVDDLSRWIGQFSNAQAVHVVHGEAQSKQDFRNRLE